MKSFNKYFAFLLTLACVLTGCNDSFDTPPLNSPQADFDEQYLISIADFKAMYWQDASSYIDTVIATPQYPHMYLKGRVISSDQSGNIYKSLVIQDETAALSMSINQNSLYTNYRLGQEIVLDLIGMYIGKYAGLMQLGEPQLYQGTTWQATFMTYEFFKQHAQIQGWPNTADIDTLVTTISALPTTPAGLQKFQSQLVRFNGVHWTEPGAVYADYQTNTNRTIADDNGGQLTVRNSGYASFSAELVPDGVGDVVGILSYFNNSWQLLLNSSDDVIGFTPASTDGTKAEPYTVERAIALQGQNKSGWVQGYIVGALKPGVNEKVTGNDDVHWGAPTVLDNTIVIGATADTKDISNALVVSLPEGSLLQKYGNLADNADVYKKKILLSGTLAGYLGMAGITTTGAAGTWEIDGVEVNEGGALASGDGSEAKPYNCAQILAKGTSVNETGVWANGYIVGWIDGMTFSSGCVFSATATSATNLLIADTPTERDPAKCVPVALPSGTLRDALNLQAHPENYGKLLKYNGDITKYFGVPGLKNGTNYNLSGEGGGSNPDPNPGTGTTLYSFSFLGEANNGGFVANNKVMPEGISFVWQSDATYGWKASAYVSGVRYATESWLTSPALAIPEGGATLSFKHALNFGTKDAMSVQISTDKTTWTPLTVPTWPAGSDWNFVESGNISLAQYAGKSVYIAFVYTSTITVSATWELKDFLIVK